MRSYKDSTVKDQLELVSATDVLKPQGSKLVLETNHEKPGCLNQFNPIPLQ